MTLACHSLFAKPAVDGLNGWRSALINAAGLRRSDDAASDEEVDEATLAANRRSAVEAARNLGAAVA